nr:DegV family protein [Tissierella sp.]
MDYKIVADSSCDLNEDIKSYVDVELIPFNISVDEKEFTDDKDLIMKDLVQAMKSSPNPIKTSCPSPGDFLESYEGSDNIFVVTIADKLSGTYNSAILARDMALEKNPEKFIHVFDSKGASVTETLTVLKIEESIKKGLSKEEVVKEVEAYIEDMKTYFISEDLSNLIKNGRISKTKGLIANILNLKPIMGADQEGNIGLVENIRGSNKAFNRLIEIIGESKKDFKERVLAISHASNPGRANELKEKLNSLYKFKEIIVVETRGLSTAYVNHEGIILAF